MWDGKNLSVKYDAERVSGSTFGPREHATLLAMGAVKENVLQVAASLSLQIQELRPESDYEYFRFGVHGPLSESPEEIEAHPVFRRHTNRWRFQSEPVPTQIIDNVRAMSEGGCRVFAVADRAMIRTIAGWVRIASEARFQSRDVHEFLGRSLRFTADEVNRRDGLDVRTLALPPGGEAFLKLIKDWNRLARLNRLRLYKLLAIIEAQPIARSPAIVVITGDSTIEAGMLFERVWTYLNAQGMAVHPYYVIADQLERLRRGLIPNDLAVSIRAMKQDILAKLAQGEQAPINILLRFGSPTKNDPHRSLRIAPDKITDFSA